MRNPDSSGEKYIGYCIDLLKELKGLMNFEYEFIEAEDGQYGRMNEMAEWNGMVKALIDKVQSINSTEFPIPSFTEVFRISFREFPLLLGRSCS